MGAEILLLTTIATAANSVISGGIAADQAHRQERRINKQADIEHADLVTQAEISKEEGNRFLAEQALGYTASGVKLEGSPLAVLEDTRKKIEENFTGQLSRAGNIRNLRRDEAKGIRRSGDLARTRGIVSGAIGSLSAQFPKTGGSGSTGVATDVQDYPYMTA